jgi:hypothetical protein
VNYEKDYAAWLEQTATLLKRKMYSSIDWENLIEEIEDMGRNQKRAVESLLLRLIEHILKLEYWDAEKERCGNHWKSEIVNFRYQIQKRLKESPSLKKHLEECFPETLEVARESVSKLTGKPLPEISEIEKLPQICEFPDF